VIRLPVSLLVSLLLWLVLLVSVSVWFVRMPLPETLALLLSLLL